MTDHKQILLDTIRKPDYIGFALMQYAAMQYIQNLTPDESEKLLIRVNLTRQNHDDIENKPVNFGLRLNHD